MVDFLVTFSTKEIFMNIFYPDYAFDSILDITLDFLNKYHINTLLLDVDNTLTTQNHPQPIE
ncbi:MAG: hypothetical protein RSB96_03075, partial [Oscillospiraceae bacterium]